MEGGEIVRVVCVCVCVFLFFVVVVCLCVCVFGGCSVLAPSY